MKYIHYLRYIIRHKWYVFIECHRYGLAWLGIIHDWSKLRPSEFFPYAEHFYGKNAKGIKTGRDKTGYYKPMDTGDPKFDNACLLHEKRNKHHWQWWVLPEDEDGVRVLEIPYKYRIEMICDWKGASRAQGHGGMIIEWWAKHNYKMQMHPKTRAMIQSSVIDLEVVMNDILRILELKQVAPITAADVKELAVRLYGICEALGEWE